MSRCRCGCGRGCRCCPGAADVGERLGSHVNQGFGGRYRHGAPVVAGVDGSDAYRAEAEPFTAKRSGTG